MNVYDEKKDNELSFWARVFYTALLHQVNDMLRLTAISETKSVENMHKTILSMLSSVISIEEIINNNAKYIDAYPGDENVFYKDGPNKKLAEDVILKIIFFKKICERLNKTISFAEFTIFYQIITNHMIGDNEEECKPKWYQIIKEFDIDFEYVPTNVKLIISQASEELTAVKIINKVMEGMQKINGIDFTLETYISHAVETMKRLDEQLKAENLFSMVNMDQAPIYAVAIQMGIVPPLVLYNIGERNSSIIPFSVLEGMVHAIWEHMVEGNEKFSKIALLRNSSLYSSELEDKDDEDDENDEDDDKEENKNDKDKPNE